jgi:hypothetical protein
MGTGYKRNAVPVPISYGPINVIFVLTNNCLHQKFPGTNNGKQKLCHYTFMTVNTLKHNKEFVNCSLGATDYQPIHQLNKIVSLILC